MMRLDTTVSISLILSLITAIGVIYNIVKGRKADNSAETQIAVQMATNFTQIEVKLNDLNQKTAETNRNFQKLDDKLDNLADKLSRQDERINTLFRYNDDVKKRLDKLEERE